MAKKKHAKRKIKVRRTRAKVPRRIKVRRTKAKVPRRIKVRQAKRPTTQKRIRIIRLPKPKRRTSRRKIRVIKHRRKTLKQIVRNAGKKFGKKVGNKIVEIKKPKQAAEVRPQEWLVNFLYSGSGRSVDFIAVAFSAKDALRFVRRELAKTEAGLRLFNNFTPRVFQFMPPRYRDAEDVGEVIER
jgi:hypothetical protein